MSPPAPLIGITTYGRNEAGDVSLPGAYLDAVQQVGGVPILLPPHQAPLDRLLEKIDGFILAGGGDIAPSLYGGAHHPTIYSVDAERDAFEFALAKAALAKQIPVLGICRGMQMLSVASGAALIPHVPDVYGDAIAHRLDLPRRPTPHPLQLEANSRLAALMQAVHIDVMSWHHQAVKTLPSGWRVAAQATDGLLEAIECEHHPWAIGVQWHPELSPHDPAHQKLFRALILAAAP
ncbi:MAG TPA: gamma-glutamyl-gamma-aminobutyrate hydrolase family protein [Thermosynechococcaceae cyanobacterium]